MFSLNWLENFLKKEAAEESQLSQQHTEVNIFDSKAEGDKVRGAALDLYGTETGALLELTWHPSNYKLFSKEYTSLQDAQRMFSQIEAQMLMVNKQILEGEMDTAEQSSLALLESLSGMSGGPLNQSTNQPVTQTQADQKESLQVSILLPALNKEAKATVQNIFFSTVEELLSWQEAQKAAQPASLPGSLPGAAPTLPPLASPTEKGPLMDTPAKPSALEQMVDQKITEKVESSLDAKARAIFEDVHAESVKVLRQLGRSWEEIKDFFNRYLKYDWDDIDVYLDQFIKAEQGGTDPGTEKVKDELADGEGQAPPKMDSDREVLPEPELLPEAAKKPAIEKKADFDFDLLNRVESLVLTNPELWKKYLIEQIKADTEANPTKEDQKWYAKRIKHITEAQGDDLLSEDVASWHDQGTEDLREREDSLRQFATTHGISINEEAYRAEVEKGRQEMAKDKTSGQNLAKKADLVRNPDSLKKGDKVTLVRSIMTKENLILKPEVVGTITQANEYSIIIESAEGNFTISKHDCSKLDKTASKHKQLCDACDQKDHNSKKDWEKCSWGGCECPCQTDSTKKEARMKVECLECGKTFSTSNTTDPKCPGCGGHDIDLAAESPKTVASPTKYRMFEPCAAGDHDDCIAEIEEGTDAVRCGCDCHAPGWHYTGEGYAEESEPQEQVELEEAKHYKQQKDKASYSSCTQCPFSTSDEAAARAHMSPENPETGGHTMIEDEYESYDPESDLEASLQLTAEKYYLDPNAEYDWEADLVDEISNRLGAHKKTWDFTSEDTWEIEYEGEDKPYVNIKLLGPTKQSSHEPEAPHKSWTEQFHSDKQVQKQDEKTFLWSQDPNKKKAEPSLSEPMYECAKCGKSFNAPQETLYSEYPGAPRTSVDYASPCCRSSYNEVGDDGTPADASLKSNVEKTAKGERPKIRELKDQLAQATKPVEIKALCDAIDALEGRMDKEKERKDQRKEEKAKKAESAPKTEAPAEPVTAELKKK